MDRAQDQWFPRDLRPEDRAKLKGFERHFAPVTGPRHGQGDGRVPAEAPQLITPDMWCSICEDFHAQSAGHRVSGESAGG